jgi:outer membrane biosynthesis protein TonB
MAFEAFLAEAQPRRRRGRWAFLASAILHGALLAVGIAYSVARVVEPSRPRLMVTFAPVGAAAPAAPPPPAAGGGGEARAKSAPRPRPTTTAIPQPRRIPPRVRPPTESAPATRADDVDDVDDDEKIGGATGGGAAGVIGGKIGGSAGGVVGGVVGGNGARAGRSAAPRILPEAEGTRRRLSGDDPDFPVLLRRRGRSYVVTAQVCVSGTGAVDSVAIQQRADPLLDRNVAVAVKEWRYQPWIENGTGVPFCYLTRFRFNAE